MTTAILEAEKQCRGPCRRRLGPGAFRRDRKSPDGREATCRDCRAARAPRGQGAALAARAEAMFADYRARRRAWDDPEYRAARLELRDWVRRHGAARSGPVVFAWDYAESEVERRVVRRK